MPKWEYLVRRLSPDDSSALRRNLDIIGEDGWELVSVVMSAPLDRQATFIFKRTR